MRDPLRQNHSPSPLYTTKTSTLVELSVILDRRDYEAPQEEAPRLGSL